MARPSASATVETQLIATQVWQRWPMAGMPPALQGPDAYDELVEGLVGSGAIEDVTHLYWYVRPSAHYPTLEFRVCDVCLDPDDAVTLAGLLRRSYGPAPEPGRWSRQPREWARTTT